MCRFRTCEWFGLCEAEYQTHIKTHKHVKALAENKFVGQDQPIKNPNKLVIEDSVAIEMEEGEIGDDEQSVPKENVAPVKRQRRCTDDRPPKRSSSQISSAERPRKMMKVTVLKERSGNLPVTSIASKSASSFVQHSAVTRADVNIKPSSMTSTVTRQPVSEPSPAVQLSDPSTSALPSTPVHDEPYEPGPVPVGLPSYQPTIRKQPTSVSVSGIYPIHKELSVSVEKLSSVLVVPPSTVKSSVNSSIPVIMKDPPSNVRLLDTKSLSHQVPVMVTASVSSGLPEPIASISNVPVCSTVSSDKILDDTLQKELKLVRSDNSFHGLKIVDALNSLERHVGYQNQKILQALKDLKPQPQSDFQQRLELAGHGSALLDILGRRHDHGKGFQRGCSICEKGNKLIIELIKNTDPKIIDPFSMYLS